MRMSHIGICVSDWKRSLRFYHDVLGFRYVHELEVKGEPSDTLLGLEGVALRAIYLEREGVRIELLHYDAPACTGDGEPRAMNQLGLTHLSLRVDDLDACWRSSPPPVCACWAIRASRSRAPAPRPSSSRIRTARGSSSCSSRALEPRVGPAHAPRHPPPRTGRAARARRAGRLPRPDALGQALVDRAPLPARVRASPRSSDPSCSRGCASSSPMDSRGSATSSTTTRVAFQQRSLRRAARELATLRSYDRAGAEREPAPFDRRARSLSRAPGRGRALPAPRLPGEPDRAGCRTSFRTSC